MDQLLAGALEVWREVPASLPPLGPAIPASAQRDKEARFDRFLAAVEAELHRLPATRAERDAARGRITGAFVEFAGNGAGLQQRHLNLLLGGGFSAIGTELGREALRFDRAVATEDILQASRNAWTACGLQVLLGAPMRLTPSIFAYSMLYPYTDNYLDDPRISGADKMGFSGRFGRRLAGERVDAANAREDAIWRLIGKIEGEFARTEFPEVFASLLRIHGAQANSLRLLRQRSGNGDVDVLGLSFEKGGASVLADGYLAAGKLDPEQARFVFEWGVLLQLADDLQDVRQDCRDGVRTLFSEAAGRGTLDEVTSRTLWFARDVMQHLRELAGPECGALKELIERSSVSMIVRSAAEAGEWYSPAYLAELEPHSPFGFAFLNERRKQFERRSGLVMRLFEAFLEGEDDEAAFPLLPNSLMPRM